MTAKADVLLVTVTEVEALAVFAELQAQLARPMRRFFVGGKTYYDLGAIGGASVAMVQSEMGASGMGAALLTVQQAIDDLTPAAIIMVGIAFGVDETRQHIGDVLVARQLLLYESQRVSRGQDGAVEIQFRGDRPPASPLLLDRFRSGIFDWQPPAPEGGAGRPPQVHFGPVISGEKLVDHQGFRDGLLRAAPDALGGEMEGAGLYVAAHTRKVDWILVKAICDWADGFKAQDKAARQRLAARNATHFVFHVLQLGGWVTSPPAAAAGAPPPELKTTAAAPATAPSQLRQLLAERLSAEELRTACFDLGIDPDDLPGESKGAKARELIAYLTRRGALDRLLQWLRANRPDVYGIVVSENSPG